MNVMPLPYVSRGHSHWTMERDALRSPVDRARQTASLAREMELEVQVEEMLERLACNPPDRLLPNAREDGIQQLREESRAYSRCSI